MGEMPANIQLAPRPFAIPSTYQLALAGEDAQPVTDIDSMIPHYLRKTAERRRCSHHQQPDGADRLHRGGGPAERALRDPLLLGQPVRHQRAGKGLGQKLAGPGLEKGGQIPRPQPGPVGQSPGPGRKAPDHLRLGQGPCGPP